MNEKKTEPRDIIFLAFSDDEKVVEQRTGLDGELTDRQGGKYVVVGWQMNHLLVALKKADRIELITGAGAAVDLHQIAWILVAAGVTKDRKIETLCAWCQVHPPSDPDDLCRAVRECYHRLAHRAKLGLAIEGVGRDVVTKAAGRVMDAIGGLASKGA